jgi:hypothetical protein
MSKKSYPFSVANDTKESVIVKPAGAEKVVVGHAELVP